MSIYMDKCGTLRKSARAEVDAKRTRQVERWLREMCRNGATVPEALWTMWCIVEIAIRNVQAEKFATSERAMKR